MQSTLPAGIRRGPCRRAWITRRSSVSWHALAGNTTTRSNVFFVWIQVDFFQAKDVGPSLTPADTGVVRIGTEARHVARLPGLFRDRPLAGLVADGAAVCADGDHGTALCVFDQSIVQLAIAGFVPAADSIAVCTHGHMVPKKSSAADMLTSRCQDVGFSTNGSSSVGNQSSVNIYFATRYTIRGKAVRGEWWIFLWPSRFPF